MLAVRSLLRSNAQITRNIVQKRSMANVVIPPREKVTNAIPKTQCNRYYYPQPGLVSDAVKCYYWFFGRKPKELLVLSGAMVIGWCAIPAWVLYNIKNYRSQD